ncbi:MAG: aminopeptidase [Candidatus Cloacimonadota bacterium]|nr:MAG: aminopeptidase [Candidatus Cloacimonadota bacterium]
MTKNGNSTKNLVYSRKSFWNIATKKEQRVAMKFADEYIDFLDNAKTARETVDFVEKELEKKDYFDLTKYSGKKKVYRINYGKSMAIAKIGTSPVSEGVNIVAAHVDAPRVDLKQNPICQDKETALALGRTHYYGGIKKYQWLSTPLALHGVVITNEGETVKICIGEKNDDPIFVIPDLLPHLSGKIQGGKKIGEAVTPENMHVVIASMPLSEKEAEDLADPVKLTVLKYLYDKYGITEENLFSAELELVPAGKARDCGIDKSMVLGYGQDDRICSYTSVRAIFDTMDNEKTAVVLLVDKEEVGSEGNTGANSVFLKDFIGDLLKYNGEEYDSYNLRKTLVKSQILSADVNAAINPNFPSVHEAANAVHLGFGVSLTKYTGSRGKAGCNDANPEFMAKLMRIFNEEKVNWQIGSLGKVDEGGGGTIAKFLAELGAEVIDCGTGLLGMHSLYELCSKADLYSTYRAYKAFFVKG